MPSYLVNGMFLAVQQGGAFWRAAASPPPPAPSGDITVALVASRTSGTAPLAVHFSAIGTTTSLAGVTDTYRQILYTFDYGDPGSGTWPISGGSKNSDASGPLGAHIFETPGTYVVRCTGSRGGSSGYQEVTITVSDPATIYPGTATVYISPSANYAGAPAGAELRTTMPTIASNKRYMVRRAESFGALDIPHGVTGTQVVAAGSGAKPVFSSVSIGTGGQAPNDSYPNDVSLVDLSVSGGITQTSAGRRFLFLRVDQPSTLGYNLNSAIDYWSDPSRFGLSMPYPGEYFMVECVSAGNTSAAGITGHMFQSAVLGCDFKSSTQHTIRFWSANQLLMAHNDISGPSGDGIRHSLKLHASDNGSFVGVTGTYAGAAAFATRRCVIKSNIFSDTDDNNSFAVAVNPENGIVSQPLEDVIVEDNRFRVGPNRVADISLSGRRMTYINNTMLVGGGAANVSAPGLHSEGLPDGFDDSYFSDRT